MPCSGNPSEYCGSANRLDMYYKSSSTVGGSLSQGCWADAVGARTLSSKTGYSNIMTVEYCAVECLAYAYFRVEYAQECYCGNSFVGSYDVQHGVCWECEGDVRGG
jgi:WSC domain